MNEERRFEIENKIISVEQIIECSNYLQKTKNYYIDLIGKDKEKNKGLYLNQAEYSYYSYMQPKLEYSITYTDGRETKTLDEYVFKDALTEPQYINNITMHLYIDYKDNLMNEETEHNMSLYLSLNKNSVYYSTSEKNLSEVSYNLNSYVRNILESGSDRFTGIVKNRFLVKNCISLAVGLVITLIVFLLLLLLKNGENESIEMLFENGILLTLLGWVIALPIGSVITGPIVNNLYSGMNCVKDGYTSGITKMNEDSYKKANEVLIGSNSNNMESRKTIEEFYKISKILILIRLVISIIILMFLYLA